jgi:hypothetical protein
LDSSKPVTPARPPSALPAPDLSGESPCALPRPGPGEAAADTSPRGARDRTLLIIAGRCGRFGNRIVLFANFVAFAEELGLRLSNCTFHSYAHLFEATRRDIYCRYPVAPRRSWLDAVPGLAPGIRKVRLFTHLLRAACLLHERWRLFGANTLTLREAQGAQLEAPEVQDRIRQARRVFVMGWTFRAPTFVQRHAEKIRRYFRPVPQIEAAAQSAVAPLRQQADVLIGVHVRHGDYRQWRGGKYFFPVNRYVAWMEEMARQFPGARVAFLVCSDEPRQTAEFPGLTVGFGPGSPLADVCALARCDYLLGPLSTFSQWASLYGGKPLFHLREDRASAVLDQFRVSDLSEIPC